MSNNLEHSQKVKWVTGQRSSTRKEANVFAYIDYHGCDTAILSLTEQFKKELDNHKVISLVPMDLSKAFDTLPHDLIVKKLED